MSETNRQDFGARVADARKKIGITQKKLSEILGASLSAVQNYESGRLPNGETLIKLSKALGCSAGWLLTGEGAQGDHGGGAVVVRKGVLPNEEMAQPATPQASIYNDTSQQSGIADLVAKTIEVLQSNTVFETALKSNIEAFHRAIVLEKQIDQVEDRIMAKIGGRLDALESSNQQLQTENAQLRHDLEESRAASAVQDTG
jgi:transcriptional regulator with XRE-family HTH domain